MKSFRALLLATCLINAPVLVSAQSADQQIQQVTGQLEAQGYSVRTIGRTWLGRVRVISVRGNREREIVYNPSTGAVLRDFIRLIDDDDDDNDSSSSSSGSGSGGGSSGSGGSDGNSGHGSHDDDDDDGEGDDDSDDDDGESDDDSDNEEDDDDDNSGSGSGGDDDDSEDGEEDD